jgi:L-lactate dehydrogenase complex protein LldG
VSAREEVLARIAAAHRAAPPPELPYEAVVRDYRTSSDLDHDQLVDLLVDRLLDYKALVRQCRAEDLPATIAVALADRGVEQLVVPADLNPTWLEHSRVTVQHDGATGQERLSVAALDATDGVLTGCAVAIAQTGTLILDGSAGTGRRVITLIPDYHLCVVLPEQIEADVPQAIARLDGTRPITMISGPSATSDIELNRVEGVHGPRTLEVIVVRSDGWSPD